MSEEAIKNIFVGLGALIVSFVIGNALDMASLSVGFLCGGLYWFNCH